MTDLEKIKELRREEFIEKAITKGFTEEQAEFLFDEIKSQIMIDSMFGGLF